MPYTVNWLVPQRVIDVKFGESLSVDELQEYDAKVVAMMEEGQPKNVHVLADISRLEQFPNLQRTQQTKMATHPHLGWIVVYGSQNIVFRAMGIIVSKLFGNRLQWCNTREEALAFLQRVDQTLIELNK
jgi:hypothetical protein